MAFTPTGTRDLQFQAEEFVGVPLSMLAGEASLNDDGSNRSTWHGSRNIISVSRNRSPGQVGNVQRSFPVAGADNVLQSAIPLQLLESPPPATREISSEVEAAAGTRSGVQKRPDHLPNLFAEIIFVLICSVGLLFSVSQSTSVSADQVEFVNALGLETSQAPWLVGSFFLSSGLSVVISGSIADLTAPKTMMLVAFAWATLWSIVGVFSVAPSRKILFFIVRAMQGLSCGALSSISMSILGRVYQPGTRKNKVFATLGAMAPLGSLLGAVQGGSLRFHLPWIFGTSAIVCGIGFVATVFTVPNLKTQSDTEGAEPPSIKDFDFLGAVIAVGGSACIISGLTQGSPTGWEPYTYVLVIVGLSLCVAFWFVERSARRPLVSNRLWKTPGFGPLVIVYFLGFGCFIGYQFFAFRFWLTQQHKSPLIVAAYQVPDAISGVFATWVVAKLMHRIRGHWILLAAMGFYAMGPVFFVSQKPNTIYWALSFPGVALSAFGPDLSFTAAAVFITSSVERSYQGSAGSVLVTVQNMSAAVATAIANSIATRVTKDPSGELDLESLRATWYFGIALAVSGAAICVTMLRMPKSEEKEHVA